MKRSPMKRKKAIARRRSKAKATIPPWKLEELPRQLFREAARKQRKWRAPECAHHARGHAHHVLYEQHAKLEGANAHDARNAMHICSGCHYAHHHRTDGHIIPATDIPPAALEYLIEVLGEDRADAYLARYYA